MASKLPPPPLMELDYAQFSWQDWFRQLRDFVTNIGNLNWNSLNFSNSNLSDIQNRRHSDLQSLQGGTSNEYYHLTQAQENALVGGSNTTLHFHNTDRDSNNFTGTPWTNLTGGGVSTQHKHDIGTPTSGTGLTLKTTQYVVVNIGGTDYKLALVN